MEERDKLVRAAQELRQQREARERAAREYAYALEKKRTDLTLALRNRLKDLKRGYAGTVWLSSSDWPEPGCQNFHIAISDRPAAFKRPVAEIEVSISDKIRVTGSAVITKQFELAVRDTEDPEEVIDLVRRVAAEILVRRGSLPYASPAWYAFIVRVVGVITALAVLIVAVFAGGAWGAIVGGALAYAAYRLITLAGSVLVLTTVGLLVLVCLAALVEKH